VGISKQGEFQLAKDDFDSKTEDERIIPTFRTKPKFILFGIISFYLSRSEKLFLMQKFLNSSSTTLNYLIFVLQSHSVVKSQKRAIVFREIIGSRNNIPKSCPKDFKLWYPDFGIQS